MIINQWVPAAHRGDAIGDSARRVRDLVRGMGHESDVYALTIDDELRDDVLPFRDRSRFSRIRSTCTTIPRTIRVKRRSM